MKLDIRHLDDIGINKSRLLTFLEICRNNNGISVGEIAAAIGDSLQSVQATVEKLETLRYITTSYEKRGGRGRKICRSTPFGVDVIQRETEDICRLLATVRKEMLSSKSTSETNSGGP